MNHITIKRNKDSAVKYLSKHHYNILARRDYFKIWRTTNWCYRFKTERGVIEFCERVFPNFVR
jgi:hypothetical protein